MEVVTRDSLRLIGRLDLNGSMINAVLILLTDSVDIRDSFVTPVRPHMAGHHVLSSGQCPAVKVMDFLYGLQPLEFIVQICHIDVTRSALHHDSHTIVEDWDGCHKDQN